MDDLSWTPPTCPEGHPLGAGQVNYSWVFCTCPAASGGGHQVAYCRIDGCNVPSYPPGHEGPVPDQR